MKKENRNKYKIEKIRRIAVVITVIALFLLLLIFIFNLSYPNIWFSILATGALTLIFLSAGLYIATWLMEINSAYKNKKYILVILLILLAFLFCYIFLNR